MKKVAILCVLSVTLAACGTDDAPATFAYPSSGEFGLNVLEQSRTRVDADVPYSFRLEASNDGDFAAVMTLLTAVPAENATDAGVWMFTQSVPATWSITTFDRVAGSQRFVNLPIEKVAAGVSDVKITFIGTGSARVDYYEGNRSEPTFSKEVDW